MQTILLVDDEPLMLRLVSLYLEPKGFRCLKETSGLRAIEIVKKQRIDLVLLDVMMPEQNGWDVCREIRCFSDVPIIMLTARTDKVDIVKGLNHGADDYIAKPFDEDELLARIDAVLRRHQRNFEKPLPPPFELELNEPSFELFYGKHPIPLTKKEFSLISLFLKHPKRVFTRDQLITSIWGHEVETEDRTIDSHVRNLREKLRRSGFPVDDYLVTVWGVGYKWENRQNLK